MVRLSVKAPVSLPNVFDSSAVSADHSLGFFRGNLKRDLRDRVSDFDHQWRAFSQSWNNLEQDQFMGDKGRYRFRRYAVFTAEHAGKICQLEDQRHFQTRFYNNLNGGVVRDYPCFQAEALENGVFQSLLECARSSVARARPDVAAWRFEAHQFRIVASDEEKGKPVPEGIHRDGVDYVFIFMINRQNVRGGVSRVYQLDGHLMAEMKLKQSLDFMVVNDHSVYHYVTPIHPLNSQYPAHRDVLVITVKGMEKLPTAAAA